MLLQNHKLINILKPYMLTCSLNVSGSEIERYESCVMCELDYLQNVFLQGPNVSKSLGVLMDDHHLPEGILKIQNISSERLGSWACVKQDGKIERYMSLQQIRQDFYLKAALYKEGAVINRDAPWQGEFSCLGSLGPARWRTACGKRHSRCACQSVTLWKSGQKFNTGENFFQWATEKNKRNSLAWRKSIV